MTFIFIAITVVISIACFSHRELFARLQFNPYQVVHRRELYRLLSHGFVHANWWHLLVNMLVLYFFGTHAEAILAALKKGGYINYPHLVYILFYLIAIVFASTISLLRHKDNHWYNSVGASGAVSAVMFFCIFFEPWKKLYLYGMIGIPGIIFAVLYLIYAQYMSRRGGDNINHDAHFLGAVFGFVMPLFISWQLIHYFIQEILSVF